MSNSKRVLKPGEQVETTLRSWEFGKTQAKGTKYVKLTFNGYIQKNLWLWSSPGAKEQGMAVLETLGFKGKDILMLRNDGALDTKMIVMVTIDEVTNKDGKYYYTASWVNDPAKAMGGFRENDSMTNDELDEFAMNTSSYIADAQDIDQPASSEHSSHTQQESHSGFTADDIPF